MTPAEVTTLRWLRGLAVALVALGAASAFVDYSGLRRWVPVDALVQSSNTGVGILLACVGYVVVRATVVAEARPARAAVRAWAGEIAVILAALVAMALVVLAVAWLDDTDLVPADATRRSLLGSLSLVWNHLVLADVLGARPDVVGSWILSVVAQGATFALVLALVGRGRTGILVMTAAPLLVLAVAWQAWQIGELGWFTAGLSSHMRADAVLAGVLAAACSSKAAAGPQAPPAHAAAVLVLPGLVLAQSFLGPEAYYRGLGLGVALVVGIVLATSSAPLATPSIHALRAARPLLFLGGAWTVVVALLGPWIQALARRGGDWEPTSRVVITAFGVLAAAYVVDQVLRPAATDMLASWRDADGPSVDQVEHEESRAGGQQTPGA